MKLYSRISHIDKRILQHLPGIITVTGIITTILALLMYASLGFFSRYYADDYCLSGMLFQQGFWKAQINSYMTWSNRYAGMFLVAISELIGRSVIRVWTVLVIILGIVSLTWMILQVDRLLNLSFSKKIALLFAELALFFMILITPQLYQVLFWRIGLVTYTLPLFVLVFLLGLVIYSSNAINTDKIPWGRAVGCGVIALFAGGFSETYLALQTSVILLAILLVFLGVKAEKRRNWLILLGSAFVGSFLAALIVVISPGNASRLTFMPESPKLLSLLVMVLKNAFIFIFSALADNFFRSILSVLIPMLFVYLHYSNNPSVPKWSSSSVILTIFVMPLIGYLLIAVAVTPAAYVQASYPDGRVLVESTFVLVLIMMVEGFLLGVVFSQLHHYSSEFVPNYLRVITVLLILTLSMYPAYDAVKTSRQIDEFRTRAMLWDKRDARIRSARLSGLLDIHEKAYNAPDDLAELSTESNNWVNACASWFYDLSSITVGDP